MKAIANHELPSLHFWTARSSREKEILRNVCQLCWDHEPNHRASMAFIRANLRDFLQHRNASRLLDKVGFGKNHIGSGEIVHSMEFTGSDATLSIDGFGNVNCNGNVWLYKPLANLSSKSDVLFKRTDAQSKVNSMHSTFSVDD